MSIMKITAAEVVLPIMRIGDIRGKGIFVPVNPRKKPIRMDRMRGFLEKLRSTGFNLKGREYQPLLPSAVPVPLEINRQTMEKYRPLMEEKARRR